MCVCGFPTHPHNSGTPAGCPIIQINSDSVYLDIALDPTASGLSPRLVLSPLGTNCKSRLSSAVLDVQLATDWTFKDSLFEFG